MRVVQIGNLIPEHSTENHLLRALRTNGHEVRAMQENNPLVFQGLARDPERMAATDLILWTRTGWDWDRIYPGGEPQAHADQRAMLRNAKAANIPVVGYHLDRWGGLRREYQIRTEPYFESTLMVTADGGSDQMWKDAGIDHVWFLPGVSRLECEPGTPRDELRSKVAFVGSWRGYHPECTHRHQLIEWLTDYGCAFWPKQGQPAMRGEDLRDLYASVDVLVGDSAFVENPEGLYTSDRIPETLGRGGYLIHPDVRGVTDGATTPSGPAWQSGKHLATWPAGDWNALGARIETALTRHAQRRKIAGVGRAFTLLYHTYETRMRQLVELLEERNLL